MRLLLLLLLSATTLSSQANDLFKDEGQPNITFGCVMMSLGIVAALSGAVYFAITNNKRREKES